MLAVECPVIMSPLSSAQLILIISQRPTVQRHCAGAVSSACDLGEKWDKQSPRHCGSSDVFLVVAFTKLPDLLSVLQALSTVYS